MKHVVNFSGGAGSWMAAKRVAEKYGTDNLILLTADTGNEAPDWHEFVPAAAAEVGGELVIVRNEEFRDIWELSFSRQLIPNNLAGFCTTEMKVKPIKKWQLENCDPTNTTTYFGYDWTEGHRLKRTRERLAAEGWPLTEAPLLWEPILSKAQILEELAASDLPTPEAYSLGLSHNNCLSTGCFKQGEAAWRLFLRVYPERYAYQEAKEQEFNAFMAEKGKERVGRKRGIIYRKRTGLPPEILTLKELRERIETQGDLFADSGDWGACGCVDSEDI